MNINNNNMKTTQKVKVTIMILPFWQRIIIETMFPISIALLLYFNHKVLSGSTFIDFLFVIIAMISVTSSFSNKVFKGTRKEAIKYLESEEYKND